MSAPLARLLHPAFLASLVALLVNDLVLKTAAPSVVTGKLSDVAGLVVLPVALCVAGRVGSRAVAWAVHVGVGAAFAALQWVPTETVLAAGRAVGVALAHTPDPTDLAALAVLPLGVRLATCRPRAGSGRTGVFASRAALAVSVFAVLATTQPPPEVLIAGDVLRAPTGPAALEELDRRFQKAGVRAVDLDSLTGEESQAAAEVRVMDSVHGMPPPHEMTAADSAIVREWAASEVAALDSLRRLEHAQGRRRYDAYADQGPDSPRPAHVRVETSWDSTSTVLRLWIYDPAEWGLPSGFETPWWRRHEPAFRSFALERLLRPVQDDEFRGVYWPQD